MSALRALPIRSALRAARLPAPAARSFHASASAEARKALAVFYSGGQDAVEEKKLLGTVENKLGLESWFKEQGFEYIVTDDKEGPDSVFQKHLKDAEILITTPFHPAYVTADLIAKAPNLKLCVTAGVGSDHVDLPAAVKHNITVAEVTGSNVQSVAEQVLLCILALVRNYVPAHQQVVAPELGWNVARIARNAYDLEGKVVGTVGCGRIGQRVLKRLQPFGCKKLLWFDYADHPEMDGIAERVNDLDEMLAQCDIVTINVPLHEGTMGLFSAERIANMKPGAWLVNTARGAICDANAVANAVKSGQLRGYAGDVWDVQPSPKDHPWRTMTNPLGGGNGMTPHYSGTTIDAQERYAAGTKDIIQRYLAGEKQEPANLIVEGGAYATKAYGQRK